jgi:hypothetical protein
MLRNIPESLLKVWKTFKILNRKIDLKNPQKFQKKIYVYFLKDLAQTSPTVE